MKCQNQNLNLALVFGRPFVKTVFPMQSDRLCLSVLSCLVLSCLSVCDVGLFWPSSFIDQDGTWYRGRPQPRRHCVLWGLSSPSPERGLWPDGWMHQDATWYGGRPQSRRLCVRLKTHLFQRCFP